MKNRHREVIDNGNKIIFKTYRLNYPYGKKSKSRKTLLRVNEVRKQSKVRLKFKIKVRQKRDENRNNKR